MTDLEGLTRRLIKKGYSDKQILNQLIKTYLDFKEIDKKLALKLAQAVLEECKKSDMNSISDPFIKDLLEIKKSHVTVGKQGVGCRGAGDFFVHKLIAKLSETESKAYLSPQSLDDAGAVRMKDIQGFNGKKYNSDELLIVTKMEGIHSRLSDFPFLCGFHVTRAALRDLYVKGAKPISIMIDIHLGDDADVGKLFDFMAGISAVSELAKVPITAGSTLRIGGDMVIGNRLCGGVAAVGVCDRILARRNIQVGDKILMTEGAGGGTITTTAVYSGNHEVTLETLNIKFLEACEIILNSDYTQHIRAMCDVTNGGLRGDLYEINYEADCGVIIKEQRVRELVNPTVLDLLENVGVDYLGVSLDALLIYCSENVADQIIADLKKDDIKCQIIGHVTESKQVSIVYEDEKEKTILPRFRESAYTKIKQEVGEKTPEKVEDMEKKVDTAAFEALKKRDRILRYLKGNR